MTRRTMLSDKEPDGEELDGIDLLIEMFALDQVASILAAAQSIEGDESSKKE